MNYETNTFLLVSSSVRSKQLLCFVRGQGQKSEQKHTTKNFVGFHNHSPPLAMVKYTGIGDYNKSLFLFFSLLGHLSSLITSLSNGSVIAKRLARLTLISTRVVVLCSWAKALFSKYLQMLGNLACSRRGGGGGGVPILLSRSFLLRTP